MTDELPDCLAEITARILGDDEAPDYIQPCVNGCRYWSVRASGLCEFCRVGITPRPRKWFAPVPITPVIASPQPGTPEGHAAYRVGRCSRCLTNPHAPGRTLCDPCWRTRFTAAATASRRPPLPSTKR